MGIPKGGIAFFDSGIGGLTVLSACEYALRGRIVYYYGDNGRAPYGNLSPKKIRRLVFRVFKKFARLKVCAAVIACNTATAHCIEDLRRKYSFPIIGVEPAVYEAARKGGEVWILATPATCKSQRFRFLCERAKKDFPKACLFPIPCEHLAEEIEKNLLNNNYDYTARLPKGNPNALVLGCTHYIYIEEKLKRDYSCKIYHGYEGVARQLRTVLLHLDELNRESQPLLRKKFFILGFLTTFRMKLLKKGFARKKKDLKREGKLRNIDHTTIFFLGKYKDINEKIYKKTYVCDVLGKMR